MFQQSFAPDAVTPQKCITLVQWMMARMIRLAEFDYRAAVEEALAEIGRRRAYIAKLKRDGAFRDTIEHQETVLSEQRLGWLRFNLNMAVKHGQMTEEERQEIIRKDREAQRNADKN